MYIYFQLQFLSKLKSLYPQKSLVQVCLNVCMLDQAPDDDLGDWCWLS